MDPKLVCASFRPNPPFTLAAHFDAVTRDQAKNVGMLEPANAAWVVRVALKTGPVRPVVLNRLAKLIASRLTWLEVSLSRLAWVVPWLTFLDLFLTPERIADDATERRLSFLTVYGRLFGHRAAQFRTLVQRCSEYDWKLRMPVPDALGAAIGRY